MINGNGKNLYNMRKIILMAGLISSFFYGCSPSNKLLQRHYNEYRATNMEQFAHDCSETFPVEENYKEGEVEILTDTVYLPGQVIPCPHPDPVTGRSEVKCPACPVVTRIEKRTDTVTKTDKAKERELYLYAARLERTRDEAVKEKDATAADAKEWKGKAKTRFWILVGLGILAVGTFILKLKKIF